MSVDIDRLREWIGRSETRSDTITDRLVTEYLATLGGGGEPAAHGRAVLAGLHWCLAPAIVPLAEIGPDGHPARGGFLPPVPLPRRMWAGSRVSFGMPLRVGDTIERISTIIDVKTKVGGSGELVFVTVEHVIRTERGESVREEQDLVFRDEPGKEGPAPSDKNSGGAATSLPAPDFTRTIKASPVLLFRFSALTFNSHRIHYDRHYAMEVEGYGGLVVHGPLQAALLLDLATTMRGDVPDHFGFRAVRPLLDGGDIVLAGRWRGPDSLDLASGPDTNICCVTAVASWRTSDRVRPP